MGSRGLVPGLPFLGQLRRWSSASKYRSAVLSTNAMASARKSNAFSGQWSGSMTLGSIVYRQAAGYAVGNQVGQIATARIGQGLEEGNQICDFSVG